jgi:hypothetical protein
METARVDIRKLQLLNDRINQTIDALNQVRFSVYAQQTGAAVTPVLGLGHTNPTVNPYFANPFVAQQAFGMGVVPFTALATGLGHTTADAFDTTNNIFNGRTAATFPFANWGYSPFAPAFASFGSGIY